MSSPIPSLNESSSISPRQQSSTLKWALELSQYIYICVLCFLTVALLLQFYWNMKRGKIKLSTQFNIHMFSWILAMIFTFVYFFPLIYYLISPAPEYNLFWLVFRGASSLAAVTTMPLSMTFLILDRIFALSYPTLVQSKYRLYAQLSTIILLLLNYLYIFNSMFWRAYIPTVETTTCMSLACIAYNKIIKIQ